MAETIIEIKNLHKYFGKKADKCTGGGNNKG